MNKERLATFIDAVLAIVITILVLELRKPDPISLNGFLALRENFFAYALSFFWLGAMWVNLHNEWYRIKRINTKTIWAAMLILFFHLSCHMQPLLFPKTLIIAQHKVFMALLF